MLKKKKMIVYILFSPRVMFHIHYVIFIHDAYIRIVIGYIIKIKMVKHNFYSAVFFYNNVAHVCGQCAFLLDNDII